MTHFLFICTLNQYRSPAAESLYRNHPTIEAKSAGTASNARRVVNQSLIEWADKIFVMEPKHAQILEKKFGKGVLQKIRCLDIPDSISYDPGELNATLTTVLDQYDH